MAEIRGGKSTAENSAQRGWRLKFVALGGGTASVLAIAALLVVQLGTVHAATQGGLGGYWKLDEGAGLSSADVSGAGNDATMHGTLPSNSGDDWTSPPSGFSFSNTSALALNGTDYATPSSDLADDMSTGDFSISSWFKASPTAPALQYLVSKLSDDGNTGYAMSINTYSVSTKLGLNLRLGDDQGNAVNWNYSLPSADNNDGDWHIATVTVNRTSNVATYYIDGTAAGSRSLVALTGSLSNSGLLTFGRESNANAGYLTGAMDDTRIYDRVLSPQEATDLAAKTYTTATWSGATSTAFGTASNWNVGTAGSPVTGVPDAFTNIIISSGTTHNLALDQSIETQELTIQSGGSMAIGTNNLAVDQGLQNHGTLTSTSGNISVEDGWDNSGNFTASSGNITMNDGLTIDSGGTFSAGASAITVESGWNNSGTFNGGTSTVTLISGQSINGSSTFYNLTSTGGGTLVFQAGSTQTIAHTLSLNGQSSNHLNLLSNSPGSQWNINPEGTYSLSYLDVSDSDNTSPSALLPTHSLDTNNNTNWDFTGPDVSVDSGVYSSGGWTGDTTPGLPFTTTSNDGVQVRYEIQVDNDSNFSSPLVDYTSALASAGSTSFTVGQAAGSGTYTVGSNGQSLSTGTYYWRVKAIDSAGLESSFDDGSFQVDTVAPDTPSANPTGGSYNSAQSVSLTSNDTGSGLGNMYYTTNGSAPDNTSTLYTGAISVSSSETIKAIAYDTVGNASGIMSDSYIIDGAAPGTPAATPAGGTYMTTQSVTLSTSDTGGSGIAGIYYTLDGSTPDNTSTLYTGAISVNGNETIKAIAYDNAGNISSVMSDSYIIDTSTPNAPTSLGGVHYVDGSWGNNTTPTLSFSVTDPDASNQVSYRIQISTTSNFSSPIIDYTSGLAGQGSTSFTVGQVAGGGSYTTGSQGQTLADDGTYYWRVKAIDDGGLSSSYTTANSGSVAFKIDTVAPATAGTPSTTSPTANARPSVSWSASSDSGSGLANPAYTLEWSTDSSFGSFGSVTTNITTATPNANLSNGTWYFRIVSVDNAGNMSTSSASSGVLVDVTGPDAPTATPNQGSYNATQSVTLSANDNSGGTGVAHIYYTTNGSTPSSSSTLYGSAISISSSETLKAIAYDNLGNAGSVMSDSYVIDETAPVLTGSVTTITPVTVNSPVWTWNAATDSGGSSLATPAYVVQWSTHSDFSSPSTDSTNTNTYTNSALAEGTWYIRVRATDGAGNTSAWITGSTSVEATPPGAPSALANTETSPTNAATIHFTWTAATVSAVPLATPAYTIQWCGNSGFTSCDSNTDTSSTTSYARALAEGTWYVRVKATDTAGNVSAWSNTATILVDLTTPAVPSATPNGGTYSGIQSVTLSSTDSGGSGLGNIYYTLNGSTPSNTSTRYTGAISVTANETIKAIAYDNAGNASGVMNQAYVINTPGVNTPAANPAGGTYNSTQSVTLSTINPDTIYYTTDGSTPTNASTLYSSPISVSTNETIKAIAYNGGTAGGTMTEAYVFDRIAPTAPIALPTGGTYSNAQAVTLTSTDAGSGVNAIYYTTNGTIPSSSSTRYTGAIGVSSSQTLKAIAYDNANNASDVTSEDYVIIIPSEAIIPLVNVKSGEASVTSAGGTAAPAAADNIAPQPITTAITNAVNGAAVSLTLPAGSKLTCHDAQSASHIVITDTGYNYPVGLVNFCFTTPDEVNTVSLTFVTNLKPTQVNVRKYNPSSKKYSDVPNAMVTETTYGGHSALLVTYQITDNGPLDTDPAVGSITDPVGIADRSVTPATKATIATVTTKKTNSSTFWWVILAIFVLFFLLVWKRRKDKDGDKKHA